MVTEVGVEPMRRLVRVFRGSVRRFRLGKRSGKWVLRLLGVPSKALVNMLHAAPFGQHECESPMK